MLLRVCFFKVKDYNESEAQRCIRHLLTIAEILIRKLKKKLLGTWQFQQNWPQKFAQALGENSASPDTFKRT
jgi:hypothetical protein